MAERSIILRLEAAVSGSVGRAFGSLNQNVGRLEQGFGDSRQEVSRLTRQMRAMTAAGEDVTDVARRLDQAKERTGEFRRELARAKERMDRLTATQRRLEGIGNAFSKVSIATGIFSAAVGFGINEVTQQIIEMDEAILRAGLSMEQGSRLIFAAQQAGIRDAHGLVEELKEVPRAIEEAFEAGGAGETRRSAFARLGLDLAQLRAQSPTDQLMAITTALRQLGREERQFLLESAGLTGTFADNALFLANLSEEAYGRYVTAARDGLAVTDEQAARVREAQAAFAELRQEILIGGVQAIAGYKDEIVALVATLTDIVGGVIRFTTENKSAVYALLAVTTASLAAAAAFKAMSVALVAYRAIQTALSAGSLLAFTNPATAAIVAFGIALAGVVWLIKQFRQSADDMANAPQPQLGIPGLSQSGGQDAAATARQLQAQAQAAVAPPQPSFASPTPPQVAPQAPTLLPAPTPPQVAPPLSPAIAQATGDAFRQAVVAAGEQFQQLVAASRPAAPQPAQQPSAARLALATAVSPGQAGLAIAGAAHPQPDRRTINITVNVTSTFEQLDGAGQQLGDDIAAQLQRRLDTGIGRHRG